MVKRIKSSLEEGVLGEIRSFLKKGWKINRCAGKKKKYGFFKGKIQDPEGNLYTKQIIMTFIPNTAYESELLEEASKFHSAIESYFKFKRQEYKLKTSRPL